MFARTREWDNHPVKSGRDVLGRSRGDDNAGSDRAPWPTHMRALAHRIGLDPRTVRRLRWLHKAHAVHRSQASIWHNLPFVLWDPEPDNFTYEIANEHELATWVATVASCEPEQTQRYVVEPEVDRTLKTRLQTATAGKWLWTKSRPPFGKRLGWYALARVLRPGLIIEVGVHDGLGALLLLRALEHNAEDGYPGRLVSFDVNPKAGWLVGQHPLWDLRIEASQQGLAALFSQGVVVDMFIYDGWHSYQAETADLSLTAEHLAPDGVLVSDDAQVTHALADLCRDRALAYFEFHEVPRQHFYPGGFLAAGRRAPLADSVRDADEVGNG
jgi:hypothetical protein